MTGSPCCAGSVGPRQSKRARRVAFVFMANDIDDCKRLLWCRFLIVNSAHVIFMPLRGPIMYHVVDSWHLQKTRKDEEEKIYTCIGGEWNSTHVAVVTSNSLFFPLTPLRKAHHICYTMCLSMLPMSYTFSHMPHTLARSFALSVRHHAIPDIHFHFSYDNLYESKKYIEFDMFFPFFGRLLCARRIWMGSARKEVHRMRNLSFLENFLSCAVLRRICSLSLSLSRPLERYTCYLVCTVSDSMCVCAQCASMQTIGTESVGYPSSYTIFYAWNEHT